MNIAVNEKKGSIELIERTNFNYRLLFLIIFCNGTFILSLIAGISILITLRNNTVDENMYNFMLIFSIGFMLFCSLFLLVNFVSYGSPLKIIFNRSKIIFKYRYPMIWKNIELDEKDVEMIEVEKDNDSNPIVRFNKMSIFLKNEKEFTFKIISDRDINLIHNHFHSINNIQGE